MDDRTYKIADLMGDAPAYLQPKESADDPWTFGRDHRTALMMTRSEEVDIASTLRGYGLRVEVCGTYC